MQRWAAVRVRRQLAEGAQPQVRAFDRTPWAARMAFSQAPARAVRADTQRRALACCVRPKVRRMAREGERTRGRVCLEGQNRRERPSAPSGEELPRVVQEEACAAAEIAGEGPDATRLADVASAPLWGAFASFLQHVHVCSDHECHIQQRFVCR
eukprot:2724752-Prymnesium_polylepis.1